MFKQTDSINCPQCDRRISSYALLCPHCGERIPQKDFGKTKRLAASGKDLSWGAPHSERRGWTNIMILLLLFMAAVGIVARFQHNISKHFKSDTGYHVSLSGEDFDRICTEGLGKTVYYESTDAKKMNQALEAYAKSHGYPNKMALLKTCAKGMYQ